MVKHTCKKCGKTFNRKSSYDNHLNNKNGCNKNNAELSTQLTNGNDCAFCNKKLSNKYNAIRHATKCKEARDKIAKLNEQKIEKNNTRKILNDILDDPSNNDLLNEILSKYTKNENTPNLPGINYNNINNINNTNNNTNNNINIGNTTINNIKVEIIKNTTICPFGEELKNGLVIGEDAIINILNKGFISPVYLIEYIHFNKELPQFQNIYTPALKDRYIRIHDGDKWIVKDKKEIMNTLVYKKTEILESKYDEYKDTDKFKKLKNTKGLEKLFDCYTDDTDKRIIDIKKEIDLNMYNNKNMPLGKPNKNEINST